VLRNAVPRNDNLAAGLLRARAAHSRSMNTAVPLRVYRCATLRANGNLRLSARDARPKHAQSKHDRSWHRAVCGFAQSTKPVVNGCLPVVLSVLWRRSDRRSPRRQALRRHGSVPAACCRARLSSAPTCSMRPRSILISLADATSRTPHRA
jgi:hypothetical protein